MSLFAHHLAILAASALLSCQARDFSSDAAAGSASAEHSRLDASASSHQLVRHAFSTSPMGTVLLYSFDPALLVGWNYPLASPDRPFIVPQVMDLPVLGGWFGRTAGVNVETLSGYRLDAIVNVATALSDFNEASARRLSSQVGVPLITLAAQSPDHLPALFARLGELTGEHARGLALRDAAQRIVQRAADVARRVDSNQRRRVYYAEGLKGLNTEPSGSIHAQLLEFVGALNVAAIPNDDVSGFGNTPVSIEQVVDWDPDIILISDYLWTDGGRAGWHAILGANPLWRRVKAVREHRVYIVPKSPFHWIDRPPSINRLAGLIWLPALLYPELCEYSLAEEIQGFYADFYHLNLGRRSIDELLETAVPF